MVDSSRFSVYLMKIHESSDSDSDYTNLNLNLNLKFHEVGTKVVLHVRTCTAMIRLLTIARMDHK